MYLIKTYLSDFLGLKNVVRNFPNFLVFCNLQLFIVTQLQCLRICIKFTSYKPYQKAQKKVRKDIYICAAMKNF